MPRTTPQDVQLILLDNYDGKTALSNFISTANAVTNWVHNQDTGSLVSSDVLIEIEKYLAAHFYCVADPGYQSRSTGGASGQFTGQTSFTFKQTRYGQQALFLDFSGALARRDKEVEEGGRRIVQVTAQTTCDNYATAEDGCGCGDY